MKRTSHLIQQLVGFIAGIGKHYPTATTITIDDRQVSTADLVTEFQGVVSADAAVKPADAARTATVANANALAEKALPDAKAFKAFVLATFGGNTVTLADFDLKPRKKAVVTPEVKSAAAEKAKATRKALGTKGSKQKKQAKKALAAQHAPEAPAPEVAPAAPAASPAPTATPPKS
jgi:hypothetical protein